MLTAESQPAEEEEEEEENSDEESDVETESTTETQTGEEDVPDSDKEQPDMEALVNRLLDKKLAEMRGGKKPPKVAKKKKTVVKDGLNFHENFGKIL